MKYIFKFNEAFLPEDKKKAITTIISYITKNSNIDLHISNVASAIMTDLIFNGKLDELKNIFTVSSD